MLVKGSGLHSGSGSLADPGNGLNGGAPGLPERHEAA